MPAQAGASYEWQTVSPGTQNALPGCVNGDVWPISQTNAFGASWTRPQPSELPIFCGLIGRHQRPVLLAVEDDRPLAPVVTSVTVMCKPSFAAVTN